MKKRPVLIAVVLLCRIHLMAQEYGSYGNITTEEKQLKICSFDKEADAVILVDEATSNYNEEHNLITQHHIRIKILREKGIDVANISIPFYSKDHFEYISDIAAAIYNDNGYGIYNTEMLDKKSVYTKKTNENFSEVRFAFPSVKAGSIIEYRYVSVMKHYGGLQDWYFQKELPVLYSKYKLYILPNTEFAYRVYKRTNLPITVKPDKQEGSLYLEMQNIAGLREEPYMDARADYLQRITFQLSAYNNGYGTNKYMSSWDEVARELRSESSFGNQLEKSIPGTEDFLTRVKAIPSLTERMKSVYDYVRGNLRWNGYYSKYSADGIKSAWIKKTGTSGEINLILINLLKAAGLEANPMLVSERSHGKVHLDYPFVDQFNSVFAAVKIDTNKYYLDAIDKFTPALTTPFDILNTTAFIISRKKSEMLNITDNVFRHSDHTNISISVARDGNAGGAAYINSTGYAKIIKVREYNNNRRQFIEKQFKNLATGIIVSDVEISNETNDSLPLVQKCNFSLSLPGSGEYKFVPLNMLPGMNSNPFIGDNRFTNINFGYQQSIELNTHVQIPDNYTVDAMPAAIKLTNGDGDIIFTRKVFYDKEKMELAFMVSLEIKKSLYLATEYDELKEFYKKMFGFLNEQLVLKKK